MCFNIFKFSRFWRIFFCLFTFLPMIISVSLYPEMPSWEIVNLLRFKMSHNLSHSCPLLPLRPKKDALFCSDFTNVISWLITYFTDRKIWNCFHNFILLPSNMEMGFLSNTTYTLEKSNESFNRIYAIFEICLFFATFAFIPFVLGVIYLMWKYPQFHTNLVILVSNLFISYGVLTIARQIVFIETYLCGDSMDCKSKVLTFARSRPKLDLSLPFLGWFLTWRAAK